MFALPTACQTTKSMDFSTVSSTECLPFRNFPGSSLANDGTPALGRTIRGNWLWRGMDLVTWTHSFVEKKLLLQEVQAGLPSDPFFPQISPPVICSICWGSMTTRMIFKSTFNWLEWMPNKSEGAWTIMLLHTLLQCPSCMYDLVQKWYCFKNVLSSQWFLNLWPKTLEGNPKSPWALASVLFKEPSILVGSDTQGERGAPLFALLRAPVLHHSSFLQTGLRRWMILYCAPKFCSKTVIRDHHIVTGVHTQTPADYISVVKEGSVDHGRGSC